MCGRWQRVVWRPNAYSYIPQEVKYHCCCCCHATLQLPVEICNAMPVGKLRIHCWHTLLHIHIARAVISSNRLYSRFPHSLLPQQLPDNNAAKKAQHLRAVIQKEFLFSFSFSLWVSHLLCICALHRFAISQRLICFLFFPYLILAYFTVNSLHYVLHVLLLFSFGICCFCVSVFCKVLFLFVYFLGILFLLLTFSWLPSKLLYALPMLSALRCFNSVAFLISFPWLAHLSHCASLYLQFRKFAKFNLMYSNFYHLVVIFSFSFLFFSTTSVLWARAFFSVFFKMFLRSWRIANVIH